MMQFINKPMAFGPQIITGSPLLSGEVGFAYATGLNSINGAPPYTYAVVSGALPPGLSIVGAAIVGTPTTIGNPYSFALVATDSHGAKSNPAGFSLTVVSMLAITTASPLPTATQGTPYATTLAASGGVSPYTWAEVAGSLDPGLSLNTATGAITGTPTTPAVYTPTFQVTDSLNYEVQKAFSLTVNTNYVAPSITTTSPLTSATNGVAYSFQMQAINGTTPYTWSLTSQTGTNTWAVSASGLVTGTPGNVETDTLNIKLVDAHPTTVGPQAFSLTVAAASVSTGLIKFIPGDGLGSSTVYDTAISQVLADLNQAVAAGLTGFNSYTMGIRWALTETSSVSTSPTYDFSRVWAGFNLVQALAPGFAFGLYVTGEWATGTINQAEITSANLGNPSNFFVPTYVLNCGGSLTIPNSFGSGSNTTYPVAPAYSGSSSYGVYFQGYSGVTVPASNETMHVTMPQWYNPGVMQTWINWLQALHSNPCPAPTVYNAGTTYSAGLQVTSGGNTYTFINATNSSGHAPPNATYWVQTNQNYVGQTLDQNQQVFFTGTNDEASINVASGQNFSVGITVNPPQSIAGHPEASATNTNFWIQQNKYLTAVTGFAPHTVFGLNHTYGFDTQGGNSDNGPNVAANINANLGNTNLTAPAALSTIKGLAYSASDTYGTDYNLSTDTASWGGQGYFGIANPSATATPTVPNLIGQMPIISQVQPLDYGRNTGTTNNTAAAVAAIMQAAHRVSSPNRIWCMNDDVNSGGPSWPTYIRNAIVANQATYPVSTLRSVDIMTGLTITSVTVASSSSLLIAYPLLALNSAETGLTGALFRNGVLVSNALNVISGAGTYTDTGLANGTYVYTLAMFNANGTGPQGAGVNGTLSGWKVLPVGGGGFVRGLVIAADGTLVGRTDSAGAYLYNGTSWIQLVTSTSMPAAYIASNPLGLGVEVSQGVYEIAIAASNTNIFYMIYGGLVFSSANKGTTWTQTAFTKDLNLNAGGNSYGQYGQKMAVDPNNSNIVYVGTPDLGLFVTINGGTSWSVVSGVPVSSGAGVTGIVFYPGGGSVGGVTQVIYAASSAGVYRTANGGTSWALTSSGPANVQNAAIDSSGNYYAVGNAGVNAFKYSGGAWSNILAPASGDQLWAIAVNPFNVSEVVAVGVGGQLYISQNAGGTFAAINRNTSLSTPDIPWLLDANSFGGTPSPFFFLDTGNVQFSPITNGLFFLSGGTGMWQMNLPAGSGTATALTWTDFSVGIENMIANHILVPPVVGSVPILASWDRPFFKITNIGTYPSTYGPVNSDTIEMGWSLDYATSNPSFVVSVSEYSQEQSGYSTDGGATWTFFASTPPGLISTYIGGSIAASTPQNIVWAPSNGSAPYYTLNQGAAWTVVTLPGVGSFNNFQHAYYNNARGVCADRVNANTFYIYYGGFGVFSSTNSGVTWSNVYNANAGFIETAHGQSGFAFTLDSVPGNAGHLFYTAGFLQGSGSTLTSPAAQPFFRSINGGAAWTQVANVLAVSCFGFGKIASGQTYPAIYIYGYVNNVLGVWQSVDNCVTWNSLGGTGANAFPTGSMVFVSCISGDPNIFGRVYLGFNGSSYVYYG